MNKLKKHPLDILLMGWALFATVVVALNLLSYFITNL